MKRIFIAYALLAAVLITSVFELVYVGNTADDYCERIEAVDSLVKQNNLPAANQRISALSDDWTKVVEKIDIMLIHDYVDSIGLNIAKMKAYLEQESMALYFSESESAKKGLASIKGSEYPNFENIL